MARIETLYINNLTTKTALRVDAPEGFMQEGDNLVVKLVEGSGREDPLAQVEKLFDDSNETVN